MRTETITLYRFNELPDAVKNRAVEDYRASDEGYHFAREAMNSIKALAEHFGGRVSDWQVNWLNTSYSSMKFDMPEMTRAEIRRRLKALGSYNRKTLKGNGDCKLTGYCSDEDAIDGFRMASHAGEVDLNALMQAAFRTWLKAAQSDAEHQFSAEGYGEFADTNELEFTAAGSLWN